MGFILIVLSRYTLAKMQQVIGLEVHIQLLTKKGKFIS
jgi:Asp-tRNA(Asn)/Glu-tRNA(Gln) amidotransferase B subunit